VNILLHTKTKLRRKTAPFVVRFWVCVAICGGCETVFAQSLDSSPPDRKSMQEFLQQRLSENPNHADLWRLLGRIYKDQGQAVDAERSFRRAISLRPDNAAAHCDLGELLFQSGNHSAAMWHFGQVLRLAPDSSYAQHLLQNGFRPTQELTQSPFELAGGGDVSVEAILPAGYEIQTFDGQDDFDLGLRKLDAESAPVVEDLRAYVEFGALYNTNVTLTPTSRELSGDGAASFQAFLSPDLEWVALRGDVVRTGPLARGYFTVNEDAFSAYDLASFQPGWFWERDVDWGGLPRIGRLEYGFTVDLLGGDRFGERHSVTASMMSIPTDANVTYYYVTASHSDFSDDGTTPSTTSLDGSAVSTGVTFFRQTARERIPTWSFGADVESAFTEGTDYRYFGGRVHGDLTWQLRERLTFLPSVAIGYRDYPDFTGAVSRNELIYRVAGKLRYQWTDAWSLSMIVAQDRFSSDNKEFDSERTEAGIFGTYLR
jgi:hypothetical protein